MTSRSEFGLDGKNRSQFVLPGARQKSLFRDASGTPQVYDFERSAQNVVGLQTKAAAIVTKYTAPAYVDASLPSNYEHYTSDGIHKGLEASNNGLQLNGKDIKLYSGSIHYFRIHPKYWRDRLRKMRACGLNCVDVAIPWNLHEPDMDKFDWGDGDNDYSLFADPATFLRIVQEEDMFALVRPGPFNCNEWDFGGLPSWLLKIPNLVVRTSETRWIARTKIFFEQVLSKLKSLQFQSGGPIIAWQIENKYGCVREMGIKPDQMYMKTLRDNLLAAGTTELLFTSDSSLFGDRNVGSLPDVFQTTDVGPDPEKEIAILKNVQPNKPVMVSEFWCGGFTSWVGTETSYNLDVNVFTENLEKLLRLSVDAVNLCMFHGGTNWGFMNGSSISTDNMIIDAYQSNTTSYDCGAPITENGDYDEKFGRTQQLLNRYGVVKTKIPVTPTIEPTTAYPSIVFADYLPFNQLLKQTPEECKTRSRHLKTMEMMNVNNGKGQSYGYINYRKTGLTIRTGDILRITGQVRDTAVVLIDGVPMTKPLKKYYDLLAFGFFGSSNSELVLNVKSGTNHTLDIMVENWGRSNFGLLPECSFFKGLEGPVLLNNEILYDWEISSMEFKSDWVRNLKNWQKVPYSSQTSPSVYRAELLIEEEPLDTWIDFSHWCKGVLWVNGYNMGRYLASGPTTTLYVPGPILRKGFNEIIIFEHYKAATQITFVNKPNTGKAESGAPAKGTLLRARPCAEKGRKLLRSSGTLLTV